MINKENNMNLRPFSSGSTFFSKYFLFLLLLLQVLQSAAIMLAHHYTVTLTILIQHNWFWIILAIFSFISFHNIKRVRIDDINKNLYVSNYLKEIVIPFSEVKKIIRRRFPRNLTIMHLSSKTEFGDQIVFIPLLSVRQELEERIGVKK